MLGEKLAKSYMIIMFIQNIDSELTTTSPETVRLISELCEKIKSLDQDIYLALDMKYKPSRNKELLQKNLGDYNEALWSLRKIAIENKDTVLKMAKDILEEGLPRYFRVDFAEYKLEDKLDMTSDEIENIYVFRGKAMEVWDELHQHLGIPW